MGGNPVIRGTEVVIEPGRRFATGTEAGFPVEGNDPRLRGVLLDTLANRPAAATYGSGWFFATDRKALYWSDGATWTITSEVPQSGLAANRPAASADLVGKLWFSTDTSVLSICDSTPAWVVIPTGGGGGAGEFGMNTRLLANDFTITANQSVYVAGPFEIASGKVLAIDSGGILEIG